LNPLDKGSEVSLANGNLDFGYTGGGSWALARSTIGVSSGKWYWEVTASTSSSFLGIASSSHTNTYVGGSSLGYGYWGVNGQKAANGGAGQSYGATYTSGDIIGVAFDADNWSLTFYKNGTSQGTAFTSITSSTYFPATSVNAAGTGSLNTGARSFAYTAPSGFKALCTANLPAPVVTKPNTVMDVALYTGNGSTQSITGLGFNPDLVWIKNRSSGGNHNIVFDSVRGISAVLYPSFTNSEFVNTGNGVTAFNSNGFTVVDDSSGLSNVNGSVGGLYSGNAQFVAWTWDAGSSTVTNTQGSITSSVRANATAGFSVMTYTGQTAAGTIGHGLGVAPSLIITKARSNAQSWGVYHKDVGINNYLLLDSTGASTSYSGIWGSSAPTSTVFGVPGNVGLNNNNGWTYVAYCFAPVVGYSSFGSFESNQSLDGPFIYCGFRPRWILVKAAIRTSGSNWSIIDAARNTGNFSVSGNGTNILYANTSGSEFSSGGAQLDILSNGFKVRNNSGDINDNGTYIYAAFAESPFNYARAR
jgi:hypothetical protein